MTKQDQLRSFKDSSEAHAAGFSTIEWLRATSFKEHLRRINAAKKLPNWWDQE
jgi:hypothetical protein